MSDVRLRFSGIIGFSAQIISLLTGLIFTTLITRNLSVIEYGQWNAIGSLLYYGSFASTLLGYWYTRYTARNVPIAKDGIFITFIFSIAGIIPFLTAAKLYMTDFEELLPIILFASIQVITTSLVYNLAAIAGGKRPEIVSYGFLVFEVAKILLALILVFGRGLDLIDVIAIVIVSEFIRAIVLAIMIRKELVKKVNLVDIKQIIKSLWLPFYNRIGGLVYASDVLVVSLLTSSYTNIGIFKLGMVFSSMVQYGSQLTLPLYVKLLGGGKEQDIITTCKLLFTFTIPFAFGIFILAKPLLFLLNPHYDASERIVQILVLYNFSLSITDFLYNVIQGSEKVDAVQKVNFSDLLHSTLFGLPTINLIRVTMYLASLSIFVLSTSSVDISAKTFGEIWAIILFLTNVPITIYLSIMTRKKMHFKVPWKNIAKYGISAIIMSIVIIYLMQFLTYDIKTSLFAPQIAGIVSIAAVTYFGFLFVIDKETRNLAKDALSLIKK